MGFKKSKKEDSPALDESEGDTLGSSSSSSSKFGDPFFTQQQSYILELEKTQKNARKAMSTLRTSNDSLRKYLHQWRGVWAIQASKALKVDESSGAMNFPPANGTCDAPPLPNANLTGEILARLASGIGRFELGFANKPHSGLEGVLYEQWGLTNAAIQMLARYPTATGACDDAARRLASSQDKLATQERKGVKESKRRQTVDDISCYEKRLADAKAALTTTEAGMRAELSRFESNKVLEICEAIEELVDAQAEQSKTLLEVFTTVASSIQDAQDSAVFIDPLSLTRADGDPNQLVVSHEGVVQVEDAPLRHILKLKTAMVHLHPAVQVNAEADAPPALVFGRPLEVLMNDEAALYAEPVPVPGWFVAILTELYNNHMEVQGIFRLSGAGSQVANVKSTLDRTAGVGFNPALHDCHALCGALKLWIRELPEPPLTYALYHDWVCVQDAEHAPETTFSMLRALFLTIPAESQALVGALFVFFAEVTKHEEVNSMPANNLSIVFTPNLITPKLDLNDLASMSALAGDTPSLNALMATLIVNYEKVIAPFGDQDEYVGVGRLISGCGNGSKAKDLVFFTVLPEAGTPGSGCTIDNPDVGISVPEGSVEILGDFVNPKTSTTDSGADVNAWLSGDFESLSAAYSQRTATSSGGVEEEDPNAPPPIVVKEWTIHRSYNETAWLRSRLKRGTSGVYVPALPEKSIVKKDTSGLIQFVERVLMHPSLCTNPALRKWLDPAEVIDADGGKRAALRGFSAIKTSVGGLRSAPTTNLDPPLFKLLQLVDPALHDAKASVVSGEKAGNAFKSVASSLTAVSGVAGDLVRLEPSTSLLAPHLRKLSRVCSDSSALYFRTFEVTITSMGSFLHDLEMQMTEVRALVETILLQYERYNRARVKLAKYQKEEVQANAQPGGMDPETAVKLASRISGAEATVARELEMYEAVFGLVATEVRFATMHLLANGMAKILNVALGSKVLADSFSLLWKAQAEALAEEKV